MITHLVLAGRKVLNLPVYNMACFHIALILEFKTTHRVNGRYNSLQKGLFTFIFSTIPNLKYIKIHSF